MEKTAKVTKQNKKISSDFENIVSLLLVKEILKKERDRNVLQERYGLLGNKPKTLEAIGKDLGVTRERVRQIEKVALLKLKKAIPSIKEAQVMETNIDAKIKSLGGFVNEERLVSIFIPTKKQELKAINAFLLLLFLNENLVRHSENKEMRTVWSAKGVNIRQILDNSKKVDSELEEKKKVLSTDQIAKVVNLTNDETDSLLWAKKNVLQTEEKKWGLITWREVNPKSIRDKTYVILKKHEEPLHYSHIAKKILEHKMQKRPVTKQAVHNELIRDDRFVLIGRGIYALREWGYEPGVVEDVIRNILKQEGRPMHKNEIIDHVKKHRIVKETTIILNLQKDSFKRVSRATYTLAD